MQLHICFPCFSQQCIFPSTMIMRTVQKGAQPTNGYWWPLKWSMTELTYDCFIHWTIEIGVKTPFPVAFGSKIAPSQIATENPETLMRKSTGFLRDTPALIARPNRAVHEFLAKSANAKSPRYRAVMSESPRRTRTAKSNVGFFPGAWPARSCRRKSYPL